ncbi:hypothetical protein [Streptomyces sp. NPDC058603]|uniref:hypothetical protein n=1 Tax=Streptomyces sp. NPDC058603 TaxID=3346551 RepID=UPI0036535DF6
MDRIQSIATLAAPAASTTHERCDTCRQPTCRCEPNTSLTVPSYPAQLLIALADQLTDRRPTATLTHRVLGHALATAATRTLSTLPTVVQADAASRALSALPQLAQGWITCGEYALRLRATAREL